MKTIIVFTTLLATLFLISLIPSKNSPVKDVYAASCGLGSSSVVAGNNLGFGYDGFPASQKIFIWDGGSNRFDLGITLTGPQTVSLNVPSGTPPGSYGGFIENIPNPTVSCGPVTVTNVGGGGGGGSYLFGTKIALGNFFSPASAFADFGSLVSRIIIILTSLVGAVSLFFIVISGIKFVTSSGDPKQIASARGTLTYAIIGLAVTILAFIILQIVQYFIGSSVPI